MTPQCSVTSLTDADLIGLVSCVHRRLVVIAPGVSLPVAKAVVETWRRLGSEAVQVVLDPDPEVCRMGYGDIAALKLLQETAEALSTSIHQQSGLRIGVVVTDETTAIFSPTPLLIEAGGRPGEKPNCIRLEAPILNPQESAAGSDLANINVEAEPLTKRDVEKTTQDLKANPPLKFDVARKVRVFNARIEFVEFELRGVLISRMTVNVPPYLMQLVKDPQVREKFRGSFQLIEEGAEISTGEINERKRELADRYLIQLTGHGSVILREAKDEFVKKVDELKKCLDTYKQAVENDLQRAIDKNRDLLVAELLPGVLANPPERWRRALGLFADKPRIERMLRSDLKKRFGSAKDLCRGMELTVRFKGITYESLNDPEFIELAMEAIPSLETLHDEFDAARAQEQVQ